MPLSDRFPGAEPGHRVRNLLVGIGFVLATALAVLFGPIIAALLVASDYREVASHLSRLPGVDADGGAKAGLVAGAYAVAIWLGLLWFGLVAASAAPVIGQDAASPAEGSGEEPFSTDDRDAAYAGSSDAELEVLFESKARQRGVDLRSADRSGDDFVVEYVVTATSPEEFADEMASLIGPYVDVVGYGYGAERMTVTAIDPDDGGDRARWRVESEWASAYIDGDRTARSIFDQILGTLEEPDDE